jgi:hypothetical protein
MMEAQTRHGCYTRLFSLGATYHLRNGRPQGLIREIAGGQERPFDIGRQESATYGPSTNFTYNNNGTRIGSRNH